MPVAALIVVGPGIEVKTVESDSLRTDWNCREGWTNIAIEAIFVHAKERRSVAHANEARQKRGGLGKRPRSPYRRAS